MDSRSRILTILGSMGAVLLIVLIVLLCTYDGRNTPSQQQTTVAQQPPETGSNARTPLEGHLIGGNPRGFLNDPTFFDPEPNAILDAAMDTSGNLSLMVTSIEKDLRVLVLNDAGELVFFTCRVIWNQWFGSRASFRAQVRGFSLRSVPIENLAKYPAGIP